MEVQPEDRAYFRGKPVRVPVRRVVAELEIHGVNERALVRVRLGEQQPDLAAVDRCAAIL